MAKGKNNGGKISKNITPVPTKKPSGRSPTVDTSGAISTPVRNTSLPPRSGGAATSIRPTSAPSPRRDITREMIQQRAYEIWQRGKGGSQQDHWYQAERELRGQ